MRTNKLLIGILAVVAITVASCSPASIASGTYSGTYSTYGASGNGSAEATIVNDNTISVKISAGGVDYNFNNVAVQKTEIVGVAYVSGSMSNSDMNFSASVVKVNGIKTVSFDMDSIGNSGYVYFDAVL